MNPAVVEPELFSMVAWYRPDISSSSFSIKKVDIVSVVSIMIRLSSRGMYSSVLTFLTSHLRDGIGRPEYDNLTRTGIIDRRITVRPISGHSPNDGGSSLSAGVVMASSRPYSSGRVTGSERPTMFEARTRNLYGLASSPTMAA